MKYYFPIHLDGGNRGCEGIAKGTAMILGEPKENLLGLCKDVELDQRLGVGKYVTLVPTKKITRAHRLFNFIVRVLNKFHVKREFNLFDQNRLFLEEMKNEDIMISTGGDMMCYGDNTPSITSNELTVKFGNRTILWGCSMGPNNLSPIKRDTLDKFSLIYARESLSYEFFKSLGLNNVVLFPDPAFVLPPQKVTLPRCFENQDVIGLNLSNFTVGDDSLNTLFGLEIKKFIDYIITQTKKHILLIPHVFWKGQDDRIIAKTVMELYKDFSDRLSYLDGNRYNYQELRYIISNCYCFIGGRTHATISAYATCVPAIALGYSIKSKGIAKDLGLDDILVIDCVDRIKQDGLIDSYNYLSANHSKIKNHLMSIMPSYSQKPYCIKEYLSNLL